MGKSFAAVAAFEGLFTTMYSYVFLKMVLKFKSFVAFGAFEFSKDGTFIVANHMPLEAINICKRFIANFARHLSIGRMQQLVFFELIFGGKCARTLRTRVRTRRQIEVRTQRAAFRDDAVLECRRRGQIAPMLALHVLLERQKRLATLLAL